MYGICLKLCQGASLVCLETYYEKKTVLLHGNKRFLFVFLPDKIMGGLGVEGRMRENVLVFAKHLVPSGNCRFSLAS